MSRPMVSIIAKDANSMLTKAQVKIVNKALEILKKDWGIVDGKRPPCKEKDYTFGCMQCEAQHVILKVDSLVNFFMAR
jgi:hypothetical protein